MAFAQADGLGYNMLKVQAGWLSDVDAPLSLQSTEDLNDLSLEAPDEEVDAELSVGQLTEPDVSRPTNPHAAVVVTPQSECACVVPAVSIFTPRRCVAA